MLANFSDVEGAFNPFPVTTQVIFISIKSIFFESFINPATPAAEAGSQYMPSFRAKFTYDFIISSSVTEWIDQPDSSRANSAFFQEAGFPILIAVAIVSGLSTISPFTIGADPSA